MNKFDIENLDLFYGDNQALKSINLPIPTRQVTALIGPSGCGKSTLLRCLNRMNDLIEGVTIKGKLDMDGTDIYGDIDVADLRIRVGMVFQKPNPFPMSIYENVAYGLRAQGIKDKKHIDEVVERSLRSAALWDEVKDRLHDSAFGLSGGQQQQLAIARALVLNPNTLILDEPNEGIQPNIVQLIRDVLLRLNKEKGMTIVLVEQKLPFAHAVGEQFYLIERGRVVSSGNMPELTDDLVKQYLSV